MKKPTIRASHRKAIETLLDGISRPFRRSDLSRALYQLTNPRSLGTADLLADAFLKELSAAGRIQRHGHLHWVNVRSGRRLLDESLAPGLAEPMTLSLNTRCPQKWLAVDLETGDVWKGGPRGWKRATTADKAMLARVKRP